MRLFKAFILVSLLYTHQASAESRSSAWILEYIDSVNVEIVDRIKDGRWTNLKEVREYAEEKLRSKRLKIQDFDGEYTLRIYGFGQKSPFCHAYLELSLMSVAKNWDGLESTEFTLLSQGSLIYHASKLNSDIVNFTQEFMKMFEE